MRVPSPPLAALAIPVLFAVLTGTASAQERGFVHRQTESMTTRIEVVLPTGKDVDAAAEQVFAKFRAVDQMMSEWKEGSPLTAVNRNAGSGPVQVPAELSALLVRSERMAERTGGAFDPSWAALWGLWDFRADPPQVPTDEDIAARLPLVNYREVLVDAEQHSVSLPRPGMKLGLGGIAKGYALDRSAALLRERGIEDFVLSSGGQVYAAGSKGDRAWRVGIRDPRGEPADYFALLEVRDASVSTSGDYERFFFLDGVRYHHILDPRTGRPSRGLRSVTVLCADATLADGLSTALMVLGAERGLALATTWEGVEAVFVDERAQVWVTPGLRERLIQVHPPKP